MFSGIGTVEAKASTNFGLKKALEKYKSVLAL